MGAARRAAHRGHAGGGNAGGALTGAAARMVPGAHGHRVARGWQGVRVGRRAGAPCGATSMAALARARERQVLRLLACGVRD